MDEKTPVVTAGEYPAYAVTKILWSAFLPYRGLEPVFREARIGATDAGARAPSAKPEEPTRDAIVNEMEHRGLLRIDAKRRSPRGERDHVIILVLAPTGKYAHFSPDLRALLGGLDSEPATRGKLDEVMLVVEPEFFRKKNLVEVVKAFQEREASGADPDGTGPVYNAFPFHVFSNDVPKRKDVPRHRIMSDSEVKAYLDRERLNPKDLFAIYSSDPPIIWLGGRPGQFVEIHRDSETAGAALVVRYITRPVG
jgi:DNA-directed RNA polymerase subunit H (RpoH/RPB5)